MVVVAVPDFVGGTRHGDSETASEARASRHSGTADERNPLVTRSKLFLSSDWSVGIVEEIQLVISKP